MPHSSLDASAGAAAQAGDGVPAILDRSVVLRDGAVHILDRRVFPERIEWVRADSPADVATAIRDMVTQSSGPLYATYAGMELAALQARDLPVDQAHAALERAGDLLRSARPTNGHPREAVERVLAAIADVATTEDLVEAAIDAARTGDEHYRDLSRALARHTLELLPDGARILTHCWMDGYLIELVRAARADGRRFEWIATETRPYLQGARLTAHTLAEMGETVTLVTDGMGAAALQPGSTLGPVDALVTAADRVSLDGAVVNKVGTLGLAVAAHAFDVPFYALVQEPDPRAATAADIVVEQRDPAEVLEVQGRRSASPLVTRAWYPAFDVTPPRFVTRVVTSHGTFRPEEVAARFGSSDPRSAPGTVTA